MSLISSLNSFSFRVSYFVFVVLLLCVFLTVSTDANGSARLIEPAMRSALWRFDPKASINFNDQSLDCGGPQIQFNLNRGRCGVCGDPYNERKENELGGRYDSGIIARRYRAGTKVTMIADLVAGNGGGYFEVKLCPRNNARTKVTQACFNKYPLQIRNGNSNKRRLKIPKTSTNNPTGLYRMDVKLPKGVTCTHCVIQWHYHASNEWGYDQDGRGCMGCGPQTEIYNCADVSIGYYGDAEGKLGQTADVSVGPLAQVYSVYANGQYGTGVSPLILNSGLSSGWASANDLTNNNEAESESESDDDQPMMAASIINPQSAGFANLFLGGEGGVDFDAIAMSDYYNNYNYDQSDYDTMNLNMMSMLMGGMMGVGGGGGESGEVGAFGPNSGRISINMRTYGGGSSGSSEEGGGRGINFRRNYAMNIPSLSRQYNTLNGGGSSSSSSSEERSSVRWVNNNNIINNNNVRSRPSNLLRLRDALRDIGNRQKLRNGLHDIVEELNNRRNGNNNINDNTGNNYDDYYNDQTPVEYYDNNVGGSGGEGSSSEEGFNPRNVPTYFRDRLRGSSGGSSDCSSGSSSSEESGCGGRRVPVVDYYPQEPEVVDYYPQEPEVVDYYPQEPEVVDYYPQEPEVVEYPDYTPPVPVPETIPPVVDDVVVPPEDYTDTGPNRGDNFNGNGNGVGMGGAGGLGEVGGVLDYGNVPSDIDVIDPLGGLNNNNNNNNYQTQEDIDFIANRQAELDRWREIEEEERQKRMKENSGSWQPPMLPPWPYNNYQTGLFPSQTSPYGIYNTGVTSPLQTNPYSMFNTGMNINSNFIPGVNSPTQTLSRQYNPWQSSNLLSSSINSPSRLSRPFPSTAYASEVSESQEASSLDEIFSWMPSANDVMSMGAAKSPIFSHKVANQYLSPFLSLSQSHPSLRCQAPDQLVCVATPNYSNIPNADDICTTKCRSGEACGSDYCSCACQKSLMCVHQSSGSVPGGQLGVTELDVWCTDQCNSGQCPNQVCACTMLI